MLYRPNYYSNDEEQDDDDEAKLSPNKAEIIVAKNRHGPTDTVEMFWDPDHTLFISVEKIRNDT
jgi:replicative DNA helicase